MYIGIQEYKRMDCIHSYVQLTFHSMHFLLLLIMIKNRIYPYLKKLIFLEKATLKGRDLSYSVGIPNKQSYPVEKAS